MIPRIGRIRFATLTIVIVAITIAGAATATTSSTRLANTPPSITSMDPSNVLGADSCAKCHANEIQVWKGTPHHSTFEEMHRRPEAREIAKRLGIVSIKYDNRCTGCHYTQKLDNGVVSAVSGISCESCHGPAKTWIDVHHDYGGEGITRATETPEHRRLRVARSVAAGMRNPHNAYTMAQSCMRCHTVPDEELVNVGGHSTGSLDFEMVSWSQGMVRHKFVTSGGTSNAMNTPQRNALLFVSGMIADLEFSLRATAKATTKSDYGYTVAKRASRSARRLAAVYKKCSIPELREIVETYLSVRLSINNEPQLLAAAERIAELGYQFADQHSGDELADIQDYVPKQERWLQPE